MLCRFYFLKEGTRVFDRAELVTYLKSEPYIKFNDDGEIKKAIYHNTVLNFDATFVMSNRSIIENIERLNPKYLDTNFYVEFELLTNSYKVNRLLDIVKVLCSRFDFCIYNEFFEDVMKFDRSVCINCFNVLKNAYKKTYEDKFVNISKLSQDSLTKVYSYLETKEDIEKNCDNKTLPYLFLREDSTRNAYLGIDLDLQSGLIIPPGAKLCKIHNGEDFYYASFNDIYKKIAKFCENIDSAIEYPVLIIKSKYIRKINKILLKTNFNRVLVKLNEVELDSILDL